MLPFSLPQYYNVGLVDSHVVPILSRLGRPLVGHTTMAATGDPRALGGRGIVLDCHRAVEIEDEGEKINDEDPEDR